jgi:crotonobetainyl-CoA:carnitine CoA-transferase CaiB-like acyl-CoA transferase
MKKQLTILSLEQALALPYATQRMVQHGWRVIRIETPLQDGGVNAGDPNRYIGADLGFHDLHSYFIAPNIGKEAITINLKKKSGQELLLKIIKELKVDVFMCNTLPIRHKQLKIDFETLKQANPNLIWCGISAMGPNYPHIAGYDPAMQALMGYTFLTGETDGKPVPCGIPVIDLKAGDEAFTQVILARMEHKSGGKEIHISMAQCAASWLITALPQIEFVKKDSELFKRSGNEHRSFIPCNVYPTKDGMVYLAIGNDAQWEKFTSQKGFEKLANNARKTNAGRMLEKEEIYREIGLMTRRFTTSDFIDFCFKLNLSAAPVNSIKEVADLKWVKDTVLKTILPNGKKVNLSPPASCTDFLKKNHYTLKCSPRMGEHNDVIMKQIGLKESEIYALKKEHVI